ncbi:MAG: TadG family pilus assembly protein [Methylococcaceae bacterium]
MNNYLLGIIYVRPISSHKKVLHRNLVTNQSLNLQRGVIIPLTAIMILSLLAFGALAVDIGYLMVARNQIQNAADAAALNGARFLYPLVGTPKKPNWTLAQTEATNAIALNKVATSSLSTGTVTTGYWKTTPATPHFQATTITPGNNDLAAVKVVINKKDNGNGGPIGTFFAKIFGINTMTVSATGVAVVASPSMVNKNLFPVAVSKCMYDAFWDAEQNQPNLINDPKYSKPPYNDPYMFGIGSAYHTADCGATNVAGQWTSFSTNNNDTTTMRDLIDYATGEQQPPSGYTDNIIGIGDNIWIEPGTKTTLYDNKAQTSVDKCSDSIDGFGDNTCAYVLLPIICPNSPTCSGIRDTTHSEMPVVGFACLNIIGADGGSVKTIRAKMVAIDSHPQCKVSGTGGGAPNFGVVLPPKLANYWIEGDNNY